MRRLSLMVMILIALILINIKVSDAQRTFPSNTKSNSRMDSQGMPMKPPALELTEEQVKALDSLRRSYMLEAMPIRTELFALRIELRHLLSDPNVQSKLLFDRQGKISELQVKLNDLSLSYQIKARSIFTKEQLAKFPQDCSLGMEVEYGMGVISGKDHIRR